MGGFYTVVQLQTETLIFQFLSSYEANAECFITKRSDNASSGKAERFFYETALCAMKRSLDRLH